MTTATESHWVGLDIGTVRHGVAVADPAGRLALPLCVLAAQPASTLAVRLLAALAGRTARALVCGLPLDQYGNAGPAAQAVRHIATSLAGELKLELHFVDERYTTSAVQRPPEAGQHRQAGRRQQHPAAGNSRGKGRSGAPPDAQAAALILQAFLDTHAG